MYYIISMQVTKKFKGSIKSAIKLADRICEYHKPQDGVRIEDENSNVVYDTARDGYECQLANAGTLSKQKPRYTDCINNKQYYTRARMI